MATNSFGARATLKSGDKSWTIFKLEALERRGLSLARLPFSIKVMLENVLRREDGVVVTADQVEAVAKWHGSRGARDLVHARARAAAGLHRRARGGRPGRDARRDQAPRRRSGADQSAPARRSGDRPFGAGRCFGTADSFAINAELEFERNRERYLFLRWGQGAFDDFRVVPPDTGIVHQVNLEYLAPVVFTSTDGQAYPDTVLGTDSHTTMINGLGVVGWGVGGIEAEAAMLGRSIPMLIPEVIGFGLTGAMRPGATATDLVLTVTQMLRKRGVVNKFVEYFGRGLGSLSVADRATLGNMSPEYGATIGFFPVDDQTLDYLRLTGRTEEQVRLVEAYCKAQGLFRTGRRAGADLHRHARARSRHGRAEPGRAAPPAGSRARCARRRASSGASWPRKWRSRHRRSDTSSSAGYPRAEVRGSRRIRRWPPPNSDRWRIGVE